jgi:hypothetical protein
MSSDILKKLGTYKATLDKPLFNDLMLCRVTGVSFDDRQETLRYVGKDTDLKLERDRHNKHDFHAVKVKALVDEVWKEVGFVPASMNKDIAQALDAGVCLDVKVWNKTGGGGGYNYGLTITIKRPD